MYAPLLLVLGLACASQARDCLQPTDMDSFDLKKFEGKWYELGWTTGNKTEENEYDDTSCVQLSLVKHTNHFDAEVDYKEKGTAMTETGKYILMDNKNSFFNIFFPDDPEYKDYLYKILCTDYTNYAVYYSGAQYGAGECSEFTVLIGRDRTKFADLIANEDVKNCLKNIQTSADKLRPIPQSDC